MLTFRLSISLFTVISLITLSASAATLTWDVNGGTTGPQNGSGTWDTTTPNWWDGAANTTWNNATPDDAQIVADGTTFTITLDEDITAGRINVLGGTGTVTFAGSNTLNLGSGGLDTVNSKNVVVNTAVNLTANQTWTLQGQTSATINGVISGTARLIKTGDGPLILNAANTHSGGTELQQGPVRIGNGQAFGTGTLFLRNTNIQSVGGPLTIANNIAQSGGGSKNWTFSGSQALTFTGNVNIGTTNPSFINTFNSSNTALTTFTGTISAHFTQRIAKGGTGTIIFAGDNDYTNETRINEGTLLINGNTTGQGDYIVAANATLGGTGSIGLATSSSVTVNEDGTFAAGESIGTLTVNGDVILDGILANEISGATTDLVVVDGDLTLGVTSVLDILGSLDGVSNYVIAQYSGELIGTFGTINGLGSYTIDYGSGNNSAVTLLIPEPASLALLSLGTVMMLCRSRRSD